MQCVVRFVLCFALGVVPNEFLFGPQPIFKLVAFLAATGLVQAVCQLGNLIVCGVCAATGVHSHSSRAESVFFGHSGFASHDSHLSLFFVRPAQ